MARGNQRDKAREKNQKESAGQKKKNTPFIRRRHRNHITSYAAIPHDSEFIHVCRKNVMGWDSKLIKRRKQQSGTEFARTKEAQAAIMRAKQEANAKKAGEGPSSGGEKEKKK
ncbi:MAG: hypothetical protein LQ350_004660 [Teloschistes chrysophthalmus]|nr:MAG: hypothetical protein LQ350_004660 [Niorma chrysophthalma]